MSIYQDNSFLGTGWGFPPEFCDSTHSVKMVSEEEDIRESLGILLFTNPGERTMHPTFGCGLKALIFETIDESIITAIKDIIERAILFFEPRITLEEIDIDVNDYNDGVIKILLEYTIRTTNTRSNMVYPYYFKEGTNISFYTVSE